MDITQYQLDMVDFALDQLENTTKKIVLGMATGTGKTFTSDVIINKLLQGPNNRVLVLAHNQLVLRNNFFDQISLNKAFEFTDAKKDLKTVEGQRLVVTIPSTIKNCYKKIGKFTHIFVDEAHERFGQTQYLEIWNGVGKPREILLTASHGMLIGDEYAKKTFSMMEGYKAGRISNLTSIGIQTAWDLTREDYTDSGELRSGRRLTRAAVFEAVTDLIENYREYFRLESKYDKLKHHMQNIKEHFIPSEFPKSLIACYDTNMCNVVYEYFNEIMPGAVSISHSKNEYDDESILNGFDADDSKRVIVVARRGNLGFNSPRTQVVVDMTGTRNPDRIMQLMGRVTRIHPEGKQKIFFKIVPEIFKVEMRRIWGVLFALGHPDYYATYDSTNYKEIPILVEREPREKDPDKEPVTKNPNGDGYTIKRVNSWMMNAAECWDLIEKMNHNDGDTVAAYVRMTIKDLERLDNRFDAPWLLWTKPEDALEFVRGLGVNSLSEWQKQHPASYDAAYNNELHRRIAEELGWAVRTENGYWTYENCKTEASKYSKLKEWQKQHQASYLTACRKQWQRQIAEELGWEARGRTENGYWTYENCKTEASKYSKLREWSKQHGTSYKAAVDNKWQRQIAEELGWEVQVTKEKGYWTYENCKTEASKYSKLAEWQKQHQASYQAARSKKWQRQIAEELGWAVRTENGYWTYETCKTEASKYSKLSEWKKQHPASYTAALNNEWQRQIAEELGWEVR